MRFVSRHQLAVAVAAVAWLGTAHEALAQCKKDTDCRDPRICEKGQCVYPQAPQQPAPAPPPVAPVAPVAPVPTPAPTPAPTETAPPPPAPPTEPPPAPVEPPPAPVEPPPAPVEPPPPPPPPPGPTMRTVSFVAGNGVTLVAVSDDTGLKKSCTGSCVVELPDGGYRVGVSNDANPPLIHHVTINNSGTLKGDYSSRVGVHLGGLGVMLGSLVVGAVLVGTGLHQEPATCPGEVVASGDCYTTNPGNAGWGVAIGVTGLIVGIVMMSVGAKGEASFMPGPATALWKPKTPKPAPKLAWGPEGLRF